MQTPPWLHPPSSGRSSSAAAILPWLLHTVLSSLLMRPLFLLLPQLLLPGQAKILAEEVHNGIGTCVGGHTEQVVLPAVREGSRGWAG